MKNRVSAISLARVAARPSRPLTYLGCLALAAVALAATSAFPGNADNSNFLAASIVPNGVTANANVTEARTLPAPEPRHVTPLVSAEEAAPAPAVITTEEKTVASEEIRWFNGRPLRAVKTISMKVTAYSPDAQSCGEWADGITASGYSVFTNGGKLVAADTSILPFGTLISVPGYDNGDPVPVLDRGGAIKGNRLDVLYPTHKTALKWGVQDLEITVWEYADGEPSNFRQQHGR